MIVPGAMIWKPGAVKYPTTETAAEALAGTAAWLRRYPEIDAQAAPSKSAIRNAKKRAKAKKKQQRQRCIEGLEGKDPGEYHDGDSYGSENEGLEGHAYLSAKAPCAT
jgi:hypothetical protein